MRWMPGIAMLCLALAVGTARAEQAARRTVSFQVNDFQLTSPVPISEERVASILTPKIGQRLSLAELHAVADELEQAIRREGWSFYRIVLPAQKISVGVVKFDVISYQLDDIRVEGNTHFDDANVLRAVPSLRSGIEPNILIISSEVNRAGRHPAKKLRLTFEEGVPGESVHARLQVRDQKPWVAFGVLQNNGSDETHHMRLTAGAQHSNVFNRDHVFNFSYTTAPAEPDAVQQYGLSYSIPFYGQNLHVSTFYANSDVDSGTIQNIFDVSGAGEIYGVSVTRYLPRFSLARFDLPGFVPTVYDHSLQASLEDRHFENDITTLGIPIGTDVRTRPAAIRYQVSHASLKNRFDFGIQWTISLSGGDDNSDSEYAANRARATNNWQNLRGNFDWAYTFASEWNATLDLDWQYSEEPLVPAEQFGIGGIRSVRGYEEREVTGDSGFALRFDVMAPPRTMSELLEAAQLVERLDFLERTRLFGFFDTGYRDNDEPPSPGTGHKAISSAGLGLLWRSDAFSLRLDVATAFDNTGETDSSDIVAHLFLLVRY